MFAVSSAGEARALPLADARVVHCRDVESCIELVSPSGTLDETSRVRLDFLPLFHSTEASLEIRDLSSYALEALPRDDNGRLTLRLARDPIGELLARERRIDLPEPFLRRYDLAVTPGVCSGTTEVEAWDAEDVELPDLLEARWSDEDWGCAILRPHLPTSGPPAARETVPARARLRKHTHVYTPPAIAAPLAWVLLNDLDLPSAERCRAAEGSVRGRLRALASEISAADVSRPAIVELDPVLVAEANGEICRQTNDRSFDGLSAAAEVLEALDERGLPLAQTRLTIIYVANVPLTPPTSLSVSMARFTEALRAGGLPDPFVAAFAADPAAVPLGVETFGAWVAPEDEGLDQQIREVLGPVWPFFTVVHDGVTVVPLLDASAESPLAWRVCRSTPTAVSPLGRSTGSLAWEPGLAGPAYQVSLPSQVLVPSGQLERPRMVVEWEGCYALCQRPAPSAAEDQDWLNAGTCQL